MAAAAASPRSGTTRSSGQREKFAVKPGRTAKLEPTTAASRTMVKTQRGRTVRRARACTSPAVFIAR